jgi:membrane peptidoglycan carboxypeptidase
MFLGIASIGLAYALIDIPEANNFAQSEATIVYWNDGKTELGRFSTENRETVDISEIPQACRDAVVAAEDRSFYDNSGFDPIGIMRAGIGYIRNSGSTSAGGGSTITQQYVKNYYLTQDQTVTRKIRELIISVKIDQQLDKDDILASYLNTIWFGRGVYGIQTASKSYFGKPVSELGVPECAGLAAVLRSPHLYDPTIDQDNAVRFKDRVQYVLDGMVSMGKLDAAAAAAVKAPAMLPEQKTNKYGGPNGYLLDQVRDELIAKGFTESEIDTGGLRVTTTFNQKAQNAAIAAVDKERPKVNADGVRVALVAVKPGDGGVVAMYGGPDAVKQPFNDAIDARIQAGSTVKPFTLAAALSEGISLKSRYSGNTLEDPILGPPVHNQNDKDYGGPVDLVTATERSINTAFVDLAMQIGPSKIVDTMLDAGFSFTSDEEAELRQNPRVTIGIGYTRPIEMAEAYATLAAGGRHADWHTVASVTEPGGNVRYEADPTAQYVLDPGVVADTTYALTQVVDGKHGTGQAAQALGRPSAGKTGTHEDLTAWYAGFTPQLSASVTLFRGAGEAGGTVSLDGVEGMDTFTGGAFPARIWTAFMAGALEGEQVVPFPERADVGEAVNPTPTSTPSPPDEPSDPPDHDNDDNNSHADESGGDSSGGDGSNGDGSSGDESSGDVPQDPPSAGDQSGGDGSTNEWGDGGAAGDGNASGTEWGDGGSAGGGADGGTASGTEWG